MSVSVQSVLISLATSNLVLWPRNNDASKVIAYVRERLGRDLPPDLEAFYRAGIRYVGDFPAIAPVWNDHVGWRERDVDVTALLPAGAVPLFLDGCGSLFGLDLTGADLGPAVYFFDREDGFERPAYAAGSSLGAFLLLLSQHDLALQEKRPAGWELAIDPNLIHCTRAPPLWLAD